MIRHLFTLIWNRKRANALLITEVFAAFIVLFAVGSLGVYMGRNYQVPLGFAYENVWRIDLNAGPQPRNQQLGTLQQVLRHLQAIPGVEKVVRSGPNTPFAFSTHNGGLDAGDSTQARHCQPVDVYDATAETRAVLGLHLTAGRWFDSRDDAATRPPVIITENARAVLFPQESPLGKIVRNGKTEFQVVGVSSIYRAGGQLSEPRAGMFLYTNPQDTTQAMATLLVRVRPGSGATLEKQINTEIHATDRSWTSSILTLAGQRRTQLKLFLTLPAILGAVCLFLIVNVALGLFGVLWQTVSQRRAEIGVRRAMGATAGAITGQIVGEILVLTTFGLALGLLVAAQFPLLGVFNVQTGVYLTAMLLAAGGLYLLAAGCALYPSRLAAGIQPAVALREE